MGWANDESIARHNGLMESDDEYRANYMDYVQEREALENWREPDDTEIDWFSDYRLAYCGFEEYRADDVLCAELIGVLDDEDLPF